MALVLLQALLVPARIPIILPNCIRKCVINYTNRIPLHSTIQTPYTVGVQLVYVIARLGVDLG